MIPLRPAAMLLPVALSIVPLAAWGTAQEQLVFGSFRAEGNAARWAGELEARFERDLVVERVHRDDGIWYRVRTGALSEAERITVKRNAAARGLETWIIRGSYAAPGTVTSSSMAPAAAAAPVAAAAPSAAARAVPAGGSAVVAGSPATAPFAMAQTAVAGPSDVEFYTDIDVGMQTRTYAERGFAGQDRFQPSLSLRMEYHRAWDDERSSITFTPFVRVDEDDDERTHADVRELFYTRVGDDWEIHVGARQIFWGVTEFNHLVDIINQTDLVENIDGEDKLGQPMIQLSLVRDWGILDLFALAGFRERTFPGEDGRLGTALPVDADDARFVSGAGKSRVDGAIRWSHHAGPVNFGLYHFSGTGRDPQFVALLDDGAPVLVPEYHVIDQTGLDAQAIFGDWAWKLEALTRSGHGDRYHAYTAGFERTLVGVAGTRSDLGVVVEYMYDQRDEAAFDTLFEHDVALGARWRANDLADTTALAGIIWDVETDEYVVSLEANRRFGASWLAVLEARVFGGADALTAGAGLAELLGGEVKSRFLQDEDFIQLELTRYF